MTSRMKQVQIWLEPDQHQVLTAIAKHTEGDLSKLLRQIIQDWLNIHAAKKKQRRLEVLNEFRLLRVEIEQQSGLIQENLLAEVRRERDQDLERNLGDLNARDD